MHISVLLKEAVENLALKQGDTVVDATVNRGGHAREFCKLIGKDGTLVGIDLDQGALDEAKEILKNEKCKVVLEQNSFRNLDKALEKASPRLEPKAHQPRVEVGLGPKKVNAILFDLGFSSDQMDDSGRGFSFQRNEPLLMTLKDNPKEEDLTAKEIVNNWEEENIADILYGYGEEKFSRQIAKKIIETRKEKPFETTQDLVGAIEKAVPNWYKHKKIHFATKTFQALRITVNDEIKALKEGLEKAFEALESGGRMAVISFHSIEDRTVKQFFNSKKQENTGEVITKKPITPSESEIKNNPRSRSAKLRVFERKKV